MKNHVIIGIDFSITSPAVTIVTPKKTETWATLTDKERDKIRAVAGLNIFQTINPKESSIDAWEDDHEGREIYIATRLVGAIDIAMGYIEDPKVFVAIEGYSFGSKNTFAHKIGEATGCLIAELRREIPDVKFFRPSPPSVKKSVGAKQKDGKQGVYDAFSKHFGVDLLAVLDKKKLGGPITDICDSWACAVWMQNHIDNLTQTEN